MTDRHHPHPRGELTEEQLRDRLHRAVAAVQPAPGALPRLRTAVPRRRAARRRAWGGAAALAAAVAVLPVVHAAQPFHLSGDPTGGQAAPGGTAPAPGRSAPATGHPHSAPAESPTAPGSTGPGTSAGPGADPSPGTSPAVPPPCTRADLGRPDARQAAAGSADGRIYGWFQLTNTADHPCRVTEPGTVAVAAGASGVRVLAHTAGDPAGGLPDPAGLPRELLLAPGGSYLVRFAWVPARCDTASPAPTGQQPTQAPSSAALPAAAGPAGSSPAPAAASDPSPTAGATPGGQASPPPAAGFTLGYALDAATGPAATTALPAGCGGTVYHSAPEPAPVPGGPAPSPSAAS
ncbi:hypothetical protein ACFV1L_25745 [Kitasatospora sp. NPDC059646]|uniref:hypothetical protein n=1 Tax=Kitasatospora sp. NPDC059646 TaxID=3346893 RepID=UPI0036B53D0E